MSEGLRDRPAVPGDSGACLRARRVDQLSQVTPAQVLGPVVDQLYRAPGARARCPAGSSNCLGGLRPGSEFPGCRPSVPPFGPSSQVPWGHPVSRETRIQFRGAAGSTICPLIWPGSQVLWGQPGVPGNSHSSLRARGVDQLSRASWALVRWSGRSMSFPGPLRPVSEGPRFRPALLGESRSALRANRFDPRSWLSRARALWPAGSTSCPGRFAPGSKGSHFRPDLPGESRSGLMSRGVDQLSRVTRASV